MYYVANTLAPSFFILAGNNDNYKVSDEFKLGQIKPWTVKLAALVRLKKYFTYLRTIQNILITCWLSGEQSLPFGLLVYFFHEILYISFLTILFQTLKQIWRKINYMFRGESYLG